jgi:hypothetical protein
MDPFFVSPPETSCLLMDPSPLETSCFLMDPKNSCLLMDPLFFSPPKTSCLLMDPKTLCLLMDPRSHVFLWTLRVHQKTWVPITLVTRTFMSVDSRTLAWGLKKNWTWKLRVFTTLKRLLLLINFALLFQPLGRSLGLACLFTLG